MLDHDELARLSSAIHEAEKRTSGEIVVVIDRIAGQFRSVTLAIALFVGLLIPWPLIVYTSYSAQRIFMVQLVLTCLLLATLLVTGRSLRLVPGFIRRRHAHQVALREFMIRGLNRTRARTGIMIYVALAEHYAEVVADTGIAERVDESRWREMIEEITGATKDGRLAEGLIGAVGQAGRLLAAEFPAEAGNEDELPNKVIII